MNRPLHLPRPAPRHNALISPPLVKERVSDDLVIANRWQGVLSNQSVVVHAGHLRNDPTRGVLVLLSFPRDKDRRSGRYIFAPRRSGSLRIVGSNGSHLNIKSASGETYRFSLPDAILSDVSGLTAW
ncbi:MAG TPA: hypothetical protein VN934_00520 [Candidatus Tumulicola sp.]|nr:hypothetical protein [Candidatus Tumulicola sp.]